jgi:hypothetical protein
MSYCVTYSQYKCTGESMHVRVHVSVKVYVSMYQNHRVGRVLSFFFSCRNWDSPTPLAAGECAPHPLVRGGGHTRLRERGWGSPNSDEGTYTVVLYI